MARVCGKCWRNRPNWNKENQSHGSGCAAAPTLASAAFARSLILLFGVSLVPTPGEQEKGRSVLPAGGTHRGTERETVERPKGIKGDRARSRGAGRGSSERETEGERERDRRHRDRKRAKLRCITLRDKERCSGGVQNRQWRGWTAAGRSRGREMVGRRGLGERRERDRE